MSDRPLPYGRVFLNRDDAIYPEQVGDDRELRAMSPYALVGREVRVPASVAGPPGKVWEVWCVHKHAGMVWVADGHTAHAAAVVDLDILCTPPHLCVNDELCCDTCMTHIGCRCPEDPS